MYGYNASNDPNATILERMASGALWGIALGGGTNIAGRIKLSGGETLGEKNNKRTNIKKSFKKTLWNK